MLNLQDVFLNQLRKDKTMVTVYLINGFQLRGCVRGFDSFTIITPTRPVKLMDSQETSAVSEAAEQPQEQ